MNLPVQNHHSNPVKVVVDERSQSLVSATGIGEVGLPWRGANWLEGSCHECSQNPRYSPGPWNERPKVSTPENRWVATRIFLEFSPGKIGEMIQFDFRIFFKWVGEKPPTSENRPFNAPKGSGTVWTNHPLLQGLLLLVSRRVYVCSCVWLHTSTFICNVFFLDGFVGHQEHVLVVGGVRPELSFANVVSRTFTILQWCGAPSRQRCDAPSRQPPT